MNKSSRLLWFLVLAQTCAVVLIIGSLAVSQPAPYARVMAARADIGNGLKTTLNLFSNDCSRYPTTTEGFQALVTCPTNMSQTIWKGPYVGPPQIPRDPWGYEYVYRCPGIHNTNSYDLYSSGPDGVSKSGGDDPDDINNWDPRSPRDGIPSADDAYFTTASILLVIPLACGVCTAAKKFSPRTRDFFDQNHTAYFLWLMISSIALLIFLSMVPRLAG